MAKYMVRRSYIQAIGPIWMPAVTAAQTYDLRDYDVENMRGDNGKITRDSVQDWLNTNAGDFQNVTDFYASIEDGEKTVEIPWKDEESELTFNDCMFGDEE